MLISVFALDVLYRLQVTTSTHRVFPAPPCLPSKMVALSGLEPLTSTL